MHNTQQKHPSASKRLHGIQLIPLFFCVHLLSDDSLSLNPLTYFCVCVCVSLWALWMDEKWFGFEDLRSVHSLFSLPNGFMCLLAMYQIKKSPLIDRWYLLCRLNILWIEFSLRSKAFTEFRFELKCNCIIFPHKNSDVMMPRLVLIKVEIALEREPCSS